MRFSVARPKSIFFKVMASSRDKRLAEISFAALEPIRVKV